MTAAPNPSPHPSPVPAADLLHALTLLAVNAVPIVLALTGGLLPVDVIILFWLEGLLAAMLNTLLVLRHRTATRRLGHFIVGTSDRDGPRWRAGSLAGSYFWRSLLLHLVYGVFFAAMVAMMVEQLPDGARWGPTSPVFLTALQWMAGMMLAEFCLDGLFAGRRPMAWIIRRTSASAGRLFAAHLFLIFGFWIVVSLPWQTLALVLLVLFKSAADLLIHLATGFLRPRRSGPPAWLVWLERDKSPEEQQKSLAEWRELEERMRAQLALSEQVLTPEAYREARRDVRTVAPRVEVPATG